MKIYLTVIVLFLTLCNNGITYVLWIEGTAHTRSFSQVVSGGMVGLFRNINSPEWSPTTANTIFTCLISSVRVTTATFSTFPPALVTN